MFEFGEHARPAWRKAMRVLPAWVGGEEKRSGDRASFLLRPVVVLLLILLGAGTAHAAEPFRVGLSLGLTGQYALPAGMQKRALELWRDEVNAAGGILGRPVDLVVENDGSDASRARAIYTRFVAGPAVDVLLAPYSSDLTSAVAPIAEDAGVPMLAPGAASDEVYRKGYRNLFGILTPASRYTQGMLRLAYDAGIASVGLLSAEDSFSRNIAEGTRKWAPFLKLRIAFDEPIGSDARLAEAVSRMQKAGVGLVVVAGYMDEALRVRRAVAAAAWTPSAYFATIGPALPDWRTQAGDLAERTFGTSVWEPNDSFAYPRSREFAAAFSKRYGVEPSYQAAAAYAAGEILAAAARQAGSADRDALRESLGNLDLYTVLGRFAVDRTGIQMKRLDMIVQWQNGRKEIVWPAEIRTAAPLFPAIP
jgi:branched-chain amino acid transport system substrate-binding protein